MTQNLDNLREQYNPDGSQLRKAQLRMLDMLKFVDTICNKHNIPYWLDSGTLLGAIRHNGFIPWDDDVDIGMLRKDIPRFKKALKKEKKHPFILQTRDNDPLFFQEWPVLRDLKSEYVQDSQLHNLRKFKGLQIDIFPFETGIYRYLLRWGQFFNIAKCNNLEKGHIFKAKIIDRICTSFLFPIWRLLGIFNKRRNILCCTYGCGYELFVKTDEIFPLKKHNFEGFDFNIPNDSNVYLTKSYGKNYMDIPSQEKRSFHTSQIIMNF